MPRSAWLVDMGFVVKAAREGNRFKLDYVAARRFLEQRLGRTDGFLFNSIDAALGVPPGLRAFYTAMERQRFAVRLLEMTGEVAAGTHRQQGVDEALSAEFAKQAALPEVGAIVLTSGDRHFLPAVEAARDVHRKRVVLFAYDVNVSGQLKAAVDAFWPFEDYEGALSRGALPR
jgi:uncharacterized LabA/DUF88 family protein